MNIKLVRHKGFTLAEVLVAVAIFAIGLLGLGLQLGGNISSTINKEVHSSVMQINMQAVEPLKQAINWGGGEFKTRLNTLHTTGQTPVFGTNFSENRDFRISVHSAQDALGNNLLTTETGSWQPPLSVVLNILYQQKEGQTLNFKTTHVFVPPKGAL